MPTSHDNSGAHLYSPQALYGGVTSEKDSTVERTRSRRVFDLTEVVADIEQYAHATDHEARTRELIRTPDHVLIVSGYQPGEGENLHGHPTHNTLTFLKGAFDLWIVEEDGQERQYDALPGTMVALDRGQPHRVQARADQEGLSVVMVSIIEGMPTSTPGYSYPVELC